MAFLKAMRIYNGIYLYDVCVHDRGQKLDILLQDSMLSRPYLTATKTELLQLPNVYRIQLNGAPLD